jgi:hypothetical protein
VTRRFRHFAAIDWSGAAGERHRGIAVALCGASGAPEIVRPGHRWSRLEILGWLLEKMPSDTLVGLDLGISLPFADCGAFFPGWDASPTDAKALWALVDATCRDDPHLAASSFVEEAAAYFRRHGGREGARFHAPDATDKRGRFRVTELAQARMGCKPYSNFNLVGAAQVGKSSLTGMRVLHRLAGRLPVWPVDPLPDSGSVVVESTPASPPSPPGARPRPARCVASRTSTARLRRWVLLKCPARASSTITAPMRCSPPRGCAPSPNAPSCGTRPN